MACARTVAVVVPSPAVSEVLLATSRTICAPMFSSGSLRSISFATVTPSLVMVGDPNFLSRTTLRPLGPSVTFTASASWLTPRRIAWRDCSPYTICFAIDVVSYFFFLVSPSSMTARTSSSRMMRNSSPSSLISWPEYFPNRMRSPDLTSSGTRLPSSFDLPFPAAMTLPCWGFSLAESGMMIPPIFCSPSSMRETMMRSCNGLTFMLCTPSVMKRRPSERWHSVGATANYMAVAGSVKGRLPADGLEGQDELEGQDGPQDQILPSRLFCLSRPSLDFVLPHLAGERVAVHPEGTRGLGQAAVALRQHPHDEPLLELSHR